MSALPPIATSIAFFGMIHTVRLMLGGRTIFTLLFFSAEKTPIVAPAHIANSTLDNMADHNFQP
jgi:hypothetical protein